ncbi:hypothetical protein [Fructobacillus tropaeoli]|uniref:hypothetical protein n=1 Tax=Fructobacillus tropaeoli TaxID=709323 RepID=UPI0030C80D86
MSVKKIDALVDLKIQFFLQQIGYFSDFKTVIFNPTFSTTGLLVYNTYERFFKTTHVTDSGGTNAWQKK